jgi:uncharacterized integral membrane protein (TIGR00698 family)
MQTGAPLFPAFHLPRAAIWPGLLLAFVLAATAHYCSELIGVDGLGFAKSPVSPVLLAILFGLLIRNLAGVPDWCETGVRFALDRVLKFGVALLGIRLSLSAVGQIGFECVPIVVGCIVTALIVVNLLSRWLGLSATLGTLIAVGTSICGCTAIMTVAPAIRARQSEVCYAITCVALFGTVGMLVYPFLAQALFADQPMAAGMFLGTAIHDTAQVIGAGMLYEQYFQSSAGLEAATVTKLVRNLSMLVVIPVLTFMFARRHPAEPGQSPALIKQLPLFIVGFVAMSLLRTVGDLGDAAFGFIPAVGWQAGVDLATQLSNLLLAVAMAAVGLSTSIAGIRRIGYPPLLMGFVAAALVGVVSVGLLSLLL